jgi:hypothetical protein
MGIARREFFILMIANAYSARQRGAASKTIARRSRPLWAGLKPAPTTTYRITTNRYWSGFGSNADTLSLRGLSAIAGSRTRRAKHASPLQ